MTELSIEKLEMVSGGMSFNCGLALTALGIGALALGSLTGGVGFYGVLALVGEGVSTVGFMTACKPSDFEF